jgi:hypothetical protein
MLALGWLALWAAPVAAWQKDAGSAFTPRDPNLIALPWEITFADGLDAEEYARQLDYFKIEIAAVARDGTVDYIWNLAKSRPDRRTGKQLDDDRLRIGWKTGTLANVDARLLRKAGVTIKGKELLHFFPDAVQDELQKLEQQYAGRKREEIRRTLFRIRPAKKQGHYHFEVVEQVPPKQSSRHTPRAVAHPSPLAGEGGSRSEPGEGSARWDDPLANAYPSPCSPAASVPLPQGERDARTAHGVCLLRSRTGRADGTRSVPATNASLWRLVRS